MLVVPTSRLPRSAILIPFYPISRRAEGFNEEAEPKLSKFKQTLNLTSFTIEHNYLPTTCRYPGPKACTDRTGTTPRAFQQRLGGIWFILQWHSDPRSPMILEPALEHCHLTNARLIPGLESNLRHPPQLSPGSATTRSGCDPRHILISCSDARPDGQSFEVSPPVSDRQLGSKHIRVYPWLLSSNYV